MGQTPEAGVEYQRGSYNGISYDILDDKLGTSTLGESLGTGDVRGIGFSHVFSGGSGDGKLEGYPLIGQVFGSEYGTQSGSSVGSSGGTGDGNIEVSPLGYALSPVSGTIRGYYDNSSHVGVSRKLEGSPLGQALGTEYVTEGISYDDISYGKVVGKLEGSELGDSLGS